MTGCYDSLSDDEPGENVALQSETKQEESLIVNDNPTRGYRCFTKPWVVTLTVLVISALSIISIAVSIDNVKCHNKPATMQAETPFMDPATALHHFSAPPADIYKLTPKDCGHDPKTARERGCHFDIMSMIWIPHECYDRELSEEFAEEKNWTWSLNENGTDLISQENIRTGEIAHGWVQFEYHIWHCLYTWRKVIKQVERGGGPIDGYVSNHEHTDHCVKTLILRSLPKETWNTKFTILYPKCYV